MARSRLCSHNLRIERCTWEDQERTERISLPETCMIQIRCRKLMMRFILCLIMLLLFCSGPLLSLQGHKPRAHDLVYSNNNNDS